MHHAGVARTGSLGPRGFLASRGEPLENQCLSHSPPGTDGLFRPSGGMEEAGEPVWAPRVLLPVFPPPSPFFLSRTAVIVFNHGVEHMTPWALHRTWLPLSLEQNPPSERGPRDLADSARTNLLSLLPSLSETLHALVPLSGIAIPELCVVWGSRVSRVWLSGHLLTTEFKFACPAPAPSCSLSLTSVVPISNYCLFPYSCLSFPTKL